MESLRLGLIGMGNIGRHHAAYLLDGKVPRCVLRSVCSTSPGKLEDYRARGVSVSGDASALAEKEGVLKEVFQSLATVPIRMVSFGGSRNNISILVETRQKEKALNLLNEGLFGLK